MIAIIIIACMSPLLFALGFKIGFDDGMKIGQEKQKLEDYMP